MLNIGFPSPSLSGTQEDDAWSKKFSYLIFHLWIWFAFLTVFAIYGTHIIMKPLFQLQ